ncbi:MAG: hypothetical protein JKY97_10915, partial [Citromicrobium sp.]|nr:hypothetical protein [Citromicrobium sp.]
VQEKRDLAESVLLRLLANWERFVDEQLVDCLNIDHSRLSEYLGVSIPAHPSKNICEAILFGGTYRDFRGFGDLKGFSKKILPEASNPFLVVHSSRTSAIDEMYKLRNYLAHYSSAAKRALKRMYEEKYEYTNFVEPGMFLLGNNCMMLWHYFDMLEGASSDMKTRYGT